MLFRSHARLAIKADHRIESTVKIDHIAVPGRLMQAIDVLRDEPAESVLLLERGKRTVRGVGLRAAKRAPAHHGSRPVTFAHVGIGAEGPPGDGLLAGPFAARVAVGRDAGCGAATCAGQHEEACRASKKSRQFGDGGGVHTDGGWLWPIGASAHRTRG